MTQMQEGAYALRTTPDDPSLFYSFPEYFYVFICQCLLCCLFVVL